MFYQGTAAYWITGMRDWSMVTSGMAYGVCKALVEDGHSGSVGELQILAFSKVGFIPRSVVLKALERNPRAWKDCARWKYLEEVLRESRRRRTILHERENCAQTPGTVDSSV
jgi:hypothetical protein